MEPTEATDPVDPEESTLATATVATPRQQSPVARAHLRFGWFALAVFATMGMVLEALHAFKVGAYLDVGNEVRRLMWTLTHAHGTLLALVNIAFALSLDRLTWSDAHQRTSSRALLAASLIIPGGFFAGGWFAHSGDPGIGAWLVPAGGMLLVWAAANAGRAAR